MTDEKDSGFGFGGKHEAKKEDKYKDCQRLKWTPWSAIKVGMRVKSALTGNEGAVSKMEKLLETIYITWDNGKESRQSRSGLENVVVLED
jgi:hypothetical protein